MKYLYLCGLNVFTRQEYMALQNVKNADCNNSKKSTEHMYEICLISINEIHFDGAMSAL